MSTFFIVQSVIEFIAILLLIFGFIYEDKVIAFEQNCKRIVVGNYRRYKRIRRMKRGNK